MVATKKSGELLFHIEEVPPWYLCILFGAQHCITMVGGTFLVPLIIAGPLGIDCALDTSLLIGTVLFVSGLATLLQTTVGIRLPIIQGATFAFLGPAFAILNSPQWAISNTNTSRSYKSSNDTNSSVATADHITWQNRICELQGGIIVVGVLQTVLGACGVVGLLVRFISPIALAPVLTLVGLGLFYPAVKMAAQGWPIALLTALILIVFWQYLANVRIPCPCAKIPALKRFPMFSAFPVGFTVGLLVTISWTLCAVLTATNVFSSNPSDYTYKSRTDTHISVLLEAPWFRIPYPFQWGWPTFSITSIIAMFAMMIAGMIESIGDYHAAARLSGAPQPPHSALNRGAMIEGIGCLMAGIIGTGNATTSYSENVGAIAVTRVGSRRVVQVAGIIILMLGMLSKFGALFATIPVPVAGGVLMVLFGIITALGLSNLQYFDLNSSRNLFIIGTSIFFGLGIPFFIQENKSVVSTGSSTVDQIIYIILGTNLLVGGGIAIFLDLTLPGTLEERGIIKWKKHANQAQSGDNTPSMSSYDLPFGMKWIRKSKVLRKVPVSPTFGARSEKIENIDTEIQNLAALSEQQKPDEKCSNADTQTA